METRKQRWSHLNKTRFIGNGKNYHLSIFGATKYRREVQNIVLKNGNIKRIKHYKLPNN